MEITGGHKAGKDSCSLLYSTTSSSKETWVNNMQVIIRMIAIHMFNLSIMDFVSTKV